MHTYNQNKAAEKMQKLAITFPILAVALAFTQHTKAADAIIYGNAITASNPSAENPFNTGEYSNTGNINLSGSLLMRGTGLTASSSTDRFSATGFNVTTTAAAIAANKYYALTLAPVAGYSIDFTSLSITLQQSGTGPTSYSLRSSLDSYSADIASGSLASGTTALTLDLSAAAYNSITSSITFELIEYGASASGGTGSINDFAFNGSVVPEPSTWIGGGLIVGLAGWSQRKRFTMRMAA